MARNDYEAAAATGCGCFRRFFGWRAEEESRSYLRLAEKEVGDKDQSNVVNKWKNLIRKIGKILNPRKDSKTSGVQFQYSPESYALNFAGDDHEDDAYLLHNFSTRFAPVGFSFGDQQRRPAM